MKKNMLFGLRIFSCALIILGFVEFLNDLIIIRFNGPGRYDQANWEVKQAHELTMSGDYVGADFWLKKAEKELSK
jgi:hypothetical protein